MRCYRQIEIVEPSPSLLLREAIGSVFSPKTVALSRCLPSFAVEEDELDLTLDLLNPALAGAAFDFPSPFSDFDAVTDLIQIKRTPFYTSTRTVQRRVDRFAAESSYLQRLCDRVSALEVSFDRLVSAKAIAGGERKYTWTAEIKAPEKPGIEKKYKWTADIKGGKSKEKNYKWTAEIKDERKDPPVTRTYTFKASTGAGGESSESEKKEKKKDKNKKKSDKAEPSTRLVEIEEPFNHGAVVLRQAFLRTVEKSKGKRKELSPQDAAIMIQMTFRAYLIRRSQALRALRELAVAKTKLKEVRALFNNFTYRRRVARDAEERQRFSEKIIVLLLTVDAIEGADPMVRAAKRSMVDELEAMLDVVDPQPAGKSFSMRRRTFDMPDGIIQGKIAAGVSEVVQMLEQENGTFEACL
ncbi:BAG family molecular chaperone regulator 7 [Diospyros lotus]|uniref:BAG family molecular chaperone regulator 7 n=1 Tax=Diospyros lotus TaxID=55363 RepID=UPI00224DA67B|nr:BAG family molecular chaperone regulator 7 [Diospyros lotus]